MYLIFLDSYNRKILSKKHKQNFFKLDDLALNPENQKNAVNIIELNKQLKESYLIKKDIDRKEKNIFIKESSIISGLNNNDFKKKSTENENNFIEKNSKLSPKLLLIKKPLQIFYQKSTNYVNNTFISNCNSPETKMFDLSKLNKNIIEINHSNPTYTYNKNISKKNIFNDNPYNNNDSNKSLTKYNSLNHSKNRKINLNNEIDIDINNTPIKKSFLRNTKEKSLNGFREKFSCISLKTVENIPQSFIDFREFLEEYMKKEENYKEFYGKEISKIKEGIKKIFDRKNYYAHMLIDYILDLWEKLEIPYCKRYKILMDFHKM